MSFAERKAARVEQRRRRWRFGRVAHKRWRKPRWFTPYRRPRNYEELR